MKPHNKTKLSLLFPIISIGILVYMPINMSPTLGTVFLWLALFILIIMYFIWLSPGECRLGRWAGAGFAPTWKLCQRGTTPVLYTYKLFFRSKTRQYNNYDLSVPGHFEQVQSDVESTIDSELKDFHSYHEQLWPSATRLKKYTLKSRWKNIL